MHGATVTGRGRDRKHPYKSRVRSDERFLAPLTLLIKAGAIVDAPIKYRNNLVLISGRPLARLTAMAHFQMAIAWIKQSDKYCRPAGHPLRKQRRQVEEARSTLRSL